MLSLAGKRAIIVGARRIGRGVAMRMVQEGVNVAIAYRRSKAEAQELMKEMGPLGRRTSIVQADLSNEADVVAMVEHTVRELGGLDFVVNLASDFERMPFNRLDGPAWDRAMAQAKGSYLLAVHTARRMMKNPAPTRGHIVLFGDSSAVQTPYVDYLPYLTAKASIDFMTRGLALELAPHGILVNAVAPGPTLRPPALDVGMWREEVIAGTPLKRESSPQDIAEIVVTLLKMETVTGETIRVDAGRHLTGHGASKE